MYFVCLLLIPVLGAVALGLLLVGDRWLRLRAIRHDARPLLRLPGRMSSGERA